MATQLAERRENPLTVIRQTMTQMAPEFKAALPSHVSVEKFTRVAQTAIQNQPDLLNVDRKSLFGAIVRLAQDGLLPDGREAAIVKFGDKAQAMPMIAGILKKVRQSGEVAKISAQVVHENDEFVWTLGFDEDVTHNPPKLSEPRGKAIGAYATCVLKDGSRLLEVMSLEEIEKVRSVSRSKGAGPWVQWWGEMARKTVMRRLSKRLPMSSDLDDAFERDATMVPLGRGEMSPVIERDASEREPDPAPVSKLAALQSRIEEAEVAEVDESGEGRGDEDMGETNNGTQADGTAATRISMDLWAAETADEIGAIWTREAETIAGLDAESKAAVSKSRHGALEQLRGAK